jgi:hypothetical protein
LRPAEPERESFRKIIGKLAETYDGPPFEPHPTLGVADKLPVLPDRLAAGAIQLETAGIFFSSAFTQALFVRFRSTPMLEELQSSLGLSGFVYDPHLSLLCRDLPADERIRLACSIALPFFVVTFDAVLRRSLSGPNDDPG